MTSHSRYSPSSVAPCVLAGCVVLFGAAAASAQPPAAPPESATAQTPQTQGAQTPVSQPPAVTPASTPAQDPQQGMPQSAQQPTPEVPAPTAQTDNPTRTPFNIAPGSRQSRPYRGVFGSPRGGKEVRLLFEGSAGLGFNGNPVTEQTSGLPLVGGAAGGGTGAGNGSGNLIFSHDRKNFGVDVNNVVYADYYPKSASSQLTDKQVLFRDIATGAVYFAPAEHTRVTLTETFKNLPEFSTAELLGGFLTDIVPPDQATGTTVQRYTRYGSGVDVTQTLSQRARLTVGGEYARGQIGNRAWTIALFSGDLSYDVVKGIAVYGGYNYGGQRDETNGVKSARETHPRLNGGVDFHRALSFSRRTTLAFSTGLAGVHDRSDNRTIYHMVGSAQLQRDLGRTWNAALLVGRNIAYSEPLDQPIVADVVAVVLNGSLTRRIDLKSIVSAARGHVGTTTTVNANNNYGTVQLSYSLSRNLAIGGDYLYSQLTAPPGALPSVEFAQLSQHTVRVYLKVWAPLLTAPRPR